MSGGTLENPNPYTFLSLAEYIQEIHEDRKKQQHNELVSDEEIKFLVDLLERLYELFLVLDYYWSGDTEVRDFNNRMKHFKKELKEML